MTKSNITQYDNTAANNTDVEDVPLGENQMYPADVNNAFRELMADLADMNDGTVTLTSPAVGSIGVTGNITVGGTVDGRDVATDGSKLDGVEASADVTDTANVTAAGAAMLTGATFTGSITAPDATFNGTTAVKLPAGTDAQRPTGVNGMLRYNSDDAQFEGYADGAWGAIAGGGETSFLLYSYTATSGQTTFTGSDDNSATLSYTAANLMVTLNGIVLENGTDYAATNGTSIVLTVSAAAGDELNVIAFKSFTVSDTVAASTGGTFSGNVAVNGDLTVDTNTLYVDSTNNRVGIGTSSPSRQLHISGSGANTRLRVENTTGSSVLDVYAEDDGNSTLNYSSVLTMSESGTERMRITSTAVELNQQLDLNNNDIYGVDQIFHEGDTNTYMQFHDSDQWRVVTGGTERFEISNSGFRDNGKPVYFARAWVTLDGNGTVSVLRSGGVSSITDLGTGSYRVNYTTAMNSSNHCVTLGDSWGNSSFERLSVAVVFSSSTTNCNVGTVLRYTNNGNTKVDSDVMHVVAHDKVVG